MLNELQTEVLLTLSNKYVWWELDFNKFPQKVLAHIMTLGIPTDIELLESAFTPDDLAEVLKNAEIGQFTNWNSKTDFDKPWVEWHKKLGLEVPPLPSKRIPD